MNPSIRITEAEERDVPLILRFIRELAEYERLSDVCVATEDLLREWLFGKTKRAEVLIAYYDNEAAGFALFFSNYSTFLARPGIYLEDLYVIPRLRGKGIGKTLLITLARIAKERNCGRFEWAVLDWNKPSIDFYESLGAKPNAGWYVYRLEGEALAKLGGA